MPTMTGLEFGDTVLVPFPSSDRAVRIGIVMKTAQARLSGQHVDGKALGETVRVRLR